jgi:polyphosphate kinase
MSTPLVSSLDDPKLYVNRELSWILFNERVLEEGRNPTVPLLERLKFIAIVGSNLDEFFMVRVAGLKQQLSVEIEDVPADGMSLTEQLSAISHRVHALVHRQYETVLHEIFPALEQCGVRIVRCADLSADQHRELEIRFVNDVFPILTPLAIDPGHPFPHLRNNSLNLAVQFSREGLDEGNPGLGVVQVPSGIARLVLLSKTDTERTFVLLEDIISLFVTSIFPTQKIEGCWPFRVTRNWDLAVDEEEAEDLLQTIQQELRRRDRGNAVRLIAHESIDSRVVSYLVSALKLDANLDVYLTPSPLHLWDLMSLTQHLQDLRELRDEPFSPIVCPSLKDVEDNDEFFSTIRQGDILLHQPYDSFDSVVEFVQRAAEDPQVLAIKQTLYRTSGDSPIVRALARAAEQGKQVTAIVELKARFDEESNIQWARALEASGVHVVYGLIGLKTHAKMCMVVRKEFGKLVRYVHLSTGNYNPSTARLYTDLSYITSRPVFGEDTGSVFNLLTGYCAPKKWNAFVIAPLGLHEAILGLIERETKNARDGKRAWIKAKLNALVDYDVIKALYRASQAVVRIDLVVRGICCLRPQVPGVSENIRVVAIVDRFLEHSRVVEVCNSGSRELFLSSADWMPRNFHSRIELLFPIIDETLRDRICYEALDLPLSDNTKAWELLPNGSYERVSHVDAIASRSQQRCIELARERARASEAKVYRAGRLLFTPTTSMSSPPIGVPLAKSPPRRRKREPEDG